MSKVSIYGIKNCDTMKKAMTWLNAQGIEYTFHDYKKSGIDADTLNQWLAQVNHEDLINRRGTTWRKLSDEEKADVDNSKAVALMMANNSLIKRPVLIKDGSLHLGFKADDYARIFNL